MFKVFNKKPKKTYRDNTILDEGYSPLQFLDKAVSEAKPLKRRTNAPVVKKQAIVDYLLSVEGQEVRYEDISAATGFVPSRVSTLIQELRLAGTIVRRGKRGHYKFTVLHKKVYRKRVPNTAVKPSVTVKKPKTKTSERPEVLSETPAIEKIYRYIAAHEDVAMTQVEIGRGSGTAVSKVSPLVRQLVKDKRIVRSLHNTKQGGTKYWLASSLVDGPTIPTQKKVSKERLVASSSDATLYAAIDSLVWQYMRDTHQTDILVFLKWLQQRK